MAIFAYGRVSTKDQTTANQKLEIESAGYKVEYWFADEGVSGKMHASQRPQFKSLLVQIRDGETLVVSKLDRLGRDAQDVGSTIKALTARGIEVIVLQLGKMDLGSPAGKLMLAMLAAVAEMERDLLVERTQSGLARAKSEGKILGRPTKTTSEQRAEIMAKYGQGVTISELARQYCISRASILAVAKPAPNQSSDH
ncbi:recombinase family protein [Undibacterium sp. Ren11W]|uniref:recombinase family protein n=1 Tax=Undibacterium sp. Ren11W TaxID=3413045 RepID=UPI003BF18510